MPDPDQTPVRRRSKLSYSLRSLMLITLLVCVYLAGRYGFRSSSPDELVGQWQAELPAGFKRAVTLKHLDGNRYVLSSGASVFNGVYEWEDGKLTVVKPDDSRMAGLSWSWDGEQLHLVDEPQDTPTGASYLGTTLTRSKPSDE
jgi:hypothetical protein